MAETNFNPNPGTIFEIQPEADDGSGGSGGGAAQTPWGQNINGGGFGLSNVSSIGLSTFGGDLVLVSNLSGEIEESTLPAGELGTILHVAGAGPPAGPPALGRGVAYNEAGNIWVYHSGAWQLQF